MPLPAGTGMDRRTFLLRSVGAALSVYGASMLSPRHFEEGIAAGRGGLRRTAGARVDLHGRRLGRAVGAGARRESRYKELRPRWGSPKAQARSSPRTKPLMWHPRPTPLAELHERGQGHGLPGDRLRAGQTRATSPAATTGRWASSTPTRAPAGWAATSTSSANRITRCRASRWTTPWRRRWRRETMPVAAVSSPADYTMWAYGLGEPIDGAGALEHSARSAPCPRPRPPSSRRATRRYDTNLVLEQDGRLRRVRRQIGRTPPGDLPGRRRIRRTPCGAGGDARTRGCRSNAPR